MERYRVTLVGADGEEARVECGADEFLLDAAEEAGLGLPWGCRSGVCGACAGRLVEGRVEHDGQSALEDHHLEAGFVLLCCARPASDCRVETERAGDL